MHFGAPDRELSRLLLLGGSDVLQRDDMDNIPYAYSVIDDTRDEALEDSQAGEAERRKIMMSAVTDKVENPFRHLNERERGQYNGRPLNNLRLLS